jgi:hypothetical protein
MTLTEKSLEQLIAQEVELVEMEEELEAIADRLGAYRSRLTVEIAKRETAAS